MNDPRPLMRAALTEAARGVGLTRPNPPVGAVVVRGSEVVGTGFHPRAGEPHAEVFALRAAGRKAKGADLVVTLEPCSTTGRTPPCTEAIRRAGIRRVVVGATDPDPRHQGRGLRLLREAGLEVVEGVLEAECRELLRPFAHRVTTGRPLVSLKLGLSLDGRIADASGRSQWITGEAARAEVQALRRSADAVWVGAETLRTDNPSLLPRPDEGRRPYRLVLDAAGRLPLALRVFGDDHAAQTLVFLGPQASPSRARALRSRGVTVHRLSARERSAQLREVLQTTGDLGLLHVLCEGGGHLAGALLAGDWVADLLLFYNPSLLGQSGRPAFVLPECTLAERPRFALQGLGPVGEDFRVHLRRRGETGPSAASPEAHAAFLRESLRDMLEY
jgi:diaminohydroxyphosphoribosylaminopyrimidine deaminase/5-amino-6-(5-phosphoribosylamino)uracil reductase